MNNELETKDTLLTLLDGSNYAWRNGEWVQVQPPTSPPQEGMITISDVRVSTPADAPNAMYWLPNEKGKVFLGATGWKVASELADDEADAPVLSPSETEEELRATVQSGKGVLQFDPRGRVFNRATESLESLRLVTKEDHAQAVEAAYREGWNRCSGYQMASRENVDADWPASEAKKKLEGMK